MSDEVRIPDVEVVVGASSNDVAVFCFYRRNDIHDGYEVVCAITDDNARAVVRAILAACQQVLLVENWHTLDELHTDVAGEEENPPF